jgi:hypothetical protein
MKMSSEISWAYRCMLPINPDVHVKKTFLALSNPPTCAEPAEARRGVEGLIFLPGYSHFDTQTQHSHKFRSSVRY